jgi:hypothetical protein
VARCPQRDRVLQGVHFRLSRFDPGCQGPYLDAGLHGSNQRAEPTLGFGEPQLHIRSASRTSGKTGLQSRQRLLAVLGSEDHFQLVGQRPEQLGLVDHHGGRMRPPNSRPHYKIAPTTPVPRLTRPGGHPDHARQSPW